jgi:AraC-like DNA-binding protein
VQRLDELDGDAVTEVLASLRVHSTIYCRTEFGAPWGMTVARADVCIFHFVLEGNCWLVVNDVEDPVRLQVGDVVLLMTGRGHRMYDDPSSTAELLDDILVHTPKRDGTSVYGGFGARTELICGSFGVEGALANPLVLSLPPLLRLEGGDPAMSEWLGALLAMLRREVDHRLPGGDAMLARRADILITQTIRTFLISLADADHPQLDGLRDARVAKAMRLFHLDPAHPWTVDTMAAEVAMSRSAFAAAFRQLTGESPMRYLTGCRLARAASQLAGGERTVFAIAQGVGYDSEGSLTRAFTRTFGIAPGAYRRRLRQHRDTSPLRSMPEVPGEPNGGSLA